MTRLSLCIATYMRGGFIAETLESILPQMTPEVELLVVDGASSDNTEEVMRSYVQRFPFIRYYREETNSGIDADYDKAVSYASGDYCWLFPDDDLLAPNALSRVLDALDHEPDLLVVDGAVKDVRCVETLKPRRMPFSGERHYSSADLDAFMIDAGEALSFIGATIIRRALWLARDRRSYYGSCFVHVGVIFQQPALDKMMAIGEPLVLIRYGNSMWTPRRFEIWAFKWPELVWRLEGYSDQAKRSLGPRFPWRTWKTLISFRARGAYSLREYRRHFADRKVGWWRLPLLLIALAPGKSVHVLGTLFLRLAGQIDGMAAYELIRCSPYANRVSRWVAGVGRRRPVAALAP